MKKDIFFVSLLILCNTFLGLLEKTGMGIHIAISVAGAIILIAYTILTKKEWKIVPLEIAMRVSYGLALISGIVLKINYISVLGIIHKVFSLLFIVALVILFVHKVIVDSKK